MRPADIRKSTEDFEELVESAKPEYDYVAGVVIGRLIGFRESSIPLVVYSGQPGVVAIPARNAVDLRGEHIGRDVVLTFEGGDPRSPIVMGWLRADEAWRVPEHPEQIEVDSDGQRVTIGAAQEIVLRCGEASITLTREGRVDIRGTYVVTHSKGVNRIRGGSVQIN
jgi:Domain of unknown function (DUF6484)